MRSGKDWGVECTQQRVVEKEIMGLSSSHRSWVYVNNIMLNSYLNVSIPFLDMESQKNDRGWLR